MTGDRAEVCSLSGGMMFQSLSDPLQAGVRFFRSPISASRQLSLRSVCPDFGREYGVAVFHTSNTSGLGSAYPPVANCQRIPSCYRNNRPHTILVQARQQLELAYNNGGSSSSLMLAIPPSLVPRSPLLATCTPIPRGTHVRRTKTWLHCRGAPHKTVAGSALPVGY
jgi:hypothetical protein